MKLNDELDKLFKNIEKEWQAKPWYYRLVWVPFWRWLTDIPYWIRSHTYRKYHYLDIRTPNYHWGYLDRDTAMLYACFNCLKEFVEKEDPFNVTDWKHDEIKRAAKKEILELYNWWTKKRFISKLSLFKEYDKDQEMLIRLIKVRGHLWT